MEEVEWRVIERDESATEGGEGGATRDMDEDEDEEWEDEEDEDEDEDSEDEEASHMDFSPIEGPIRVDNRALHIGEKVSLRHLVPSSIASPSTSAASPSPSSSAPKTLAEQIISALEQEAASFVKLQRKASEHESKVLLDLVKKHGLDYAAMARDMKLNRYQLSAGQLKKKFERWEKGGVHAIKLPEN
ncbi:Nucleolar protein 16 [Borealophlyctis nickersoniae]|nr:Nucleolar protein 16 [Borealophlyctis nickersoniae]